MQEKLISLLTQWNSLQQRNVAGSLVGAMFQLRTQIHDYLGSQTPKILAGEISQVLTMHDVNVLRGCNPKGAVYDLVEGRRLALLGTLYSWPSGMGSSLAQGGNP